MAPPSSEALNAEYRLDQSLAAMDARMREIAETLGWLRAALTPVRTAWRIIRGRW